MDSLSLIKQLKSLATIEPDPVFLKWSRRSIVAAAELEGRPVLRSFGFGTRLNSLFKTSFRFSAIAGLATAAVIFIALQTTTPSPSPIASLNDASISNEQQQAAAHNQTTQVKYYKGISPTIALALNDIVDPATNWGSAHHIKQSISALYDKNN